MSNFYFKYWNSDTPVFSQLLEVKHSPTGLLPIFSPFTLPNNLRADVTNVAPYYCCLDVFTHSIRWILRVEILELFTYLCIQCCIVSNNTWCLIFKWSWHVHMCVCVCTHAHICTVLKIKLKCIHCKAMKFEVIKNWKCKLFLCKISERSYLDKCLSKKFISLDAYKNR